LPSCTARRTSGKTLTTPTVEPTSASTHEHFCAFDDASRFAPLPVGIAGPVVALADPARMLTAGAAVVVVVDGAVVQTAAAETLTRQQ
jgi:hypothetical protein